MHNAFANARTEDTRHNLAMSYPSGQHFLQIPGPTNVPDRILRALAAPTMDHRGPDFGRIGREVLEAMARVGMIVCCSHTGERTAMDVFEHAANPVILSHSNPAALQPHPRNVSDRVMRACAETGGVVGITGFGYFLQHQDTSPDNFVRHVEYAVECVGPDHVALGLDYVFDEQELNDFLENHPDLYPQSAGYTGSSEMIAPEQMPAITDALLRHGYPESTIRGILGENLLRVCRQVWK